MSRRRHSGRERLAYVIAAIVVVLTCLGLADLTEQAKDLVR